MTGITAVVAVLAVSGGGLRAEDTWCALGTYTRVVAAERVQRAQEAYEREALALDRSTAERTYWYRRYEYALDRWYHDDIRVIENQARRISGEPFVRRGSAVSSGRHRELYMRHRWLTDWLDRRDSLRGYGSGGSVRVRGR